MNSYDYVIVGAGLAGDSAIKGIRAFDKEGSILLIGKEKERPYHRPPLSKKLILGKKKLDEIYIHDEKFYSESKVDLNLGNEVAEITPAGKSIKDVSGKTYSYQKLLLATGGSPRKLNIPGVEKSEAIYFRYRQDYLKLAEYVHEGKSILIIGGGFIGAELASALRQRGVEVTVVFPDTFMLQRVFPKSLAQAVQNDYMARGVRVLFKDAATYLESKKGKTYTTTTSGKDLEFDAVVIGIGIDPDVSLAKKSGLKTSNGIEVDEFLQSSDPDIYSAGDVASFPYKALNSTMRIEHWDNAAMQGEHAGSNMAGAGKPYDYMPYFFSDLFDFGFEAVGEVNSSLETYCDWKEENRKGIVYYLKDDVVRGIMMCNVWDKVEEARKIILYKKKGRNKHISF